MLNKISFRYAIPLLMACALLVAPRVARAEAARQEYPRLSTPCLECHDGRDSTLAGTAHWSAGDKHDGPDARVACTDCHRGDPRHWGGEPETYPMSVGAKLDATAETRLCSACHQNTHQQNMAGKSPHTAANVNCSACHTVHESKQASLLRKPEPGLCYGCHTNVQGEFAKPYRHPVNDGVIKCSECHMTLSETRRQLSYNGTNVCVRCHAEMAGPFPHEHPATLDFSTEEGGCITCHEPHGGYLPRMLKQPYEAPNFQLCTQCHSVPLHEQNVMHGTRWAGKPCQDCHVDIHGSYDNRLYVNESLKSQGCFNSGCHHI